MNSKNIILCFSKENYEIKGSMTLDEFKRYMNLLPKEEAIKIGKAMRKDVNEYLSLVPKRERKIIEKSVGQLNPIIDIEQNDWKEKYLEEKNKREKLEKEFNEFKIEVKQLITELRQEIKILRQENQQLKQENQQLRKEVQILREKVNYYDKKYNNECFSKI
ncbi:hypothetical protein [Spiroplasma floricola]|uniref:Uncharacterized protein n=1 Tax=Spiroplasma floricola 23-6 TaxID=1336749 RepID=A0A2K8SDL8_9MOLU|nr:hypothetical protein [Spiroplasma floricola]AUB31554.1 hypothetical protein SFLOR_v1c05020 [Spiroplasma floricola 23-6]